MTSWKRIALEVQGDFFSEVAEPPDGELDRRWAKFTGAPHDHGGTGGDPRGWFNLKRQFS